MSGYPRWIRSCPAGESGARSVAALWQRLNANIPPSPAKPLTVAAGALPKPRVDASGLIAHFARVGRVRGTGGEQDTRR